MGSIVRGVAAEGLEIDGLRLGRPRRLAISASAAESADDRSRPHGRAKMITADVPEPPKNPDTTPEVVATYCLPSI